VLKCIPCRTGSSEPECRALHVCVNPRVGMHAFSMPHLLTCQHLDAVLELRHLLLPRVQARLLAVAVLPLCNPVALTGPARSPSSSAEDIS